MTPNEVKAIAEASSREAVREILTSLGIDVTNPIKTQAAFAAFRKVVLDEEFEADQAHLRKWRKSVETVQQKGLAASVTVIVTGVLGLVGYFIKSKLGG
jgi:hypothetical protein